MKRSMNARRLGAAVFLAGSLLAQAAPGLAQPAAADASQVSAPVDPERLAMARRLFAATHLDTAMHGMFANTLKSNAALPADAQANPKIQQMMASYGVGLDATFPELMDEMAQVYARVLTTQELKDSLGFYESPAGQAILNKTPEVMKQILPMTMKLTPKIAAAAEKDYCSHETCTEADHKIFRRMENFGGAAASPPAGN